MARINSDRGFIVLGPHARRKLYETYTQARDAAIEKCKANRQKEFLIVNIVGSVEFEKEQRK
jgi:hypothetical protein